MSHGQSFDLKAIKLGLRKNLKHEILVKNSHDLEYKDDCDTHVASIILTFFLLIITDLFWT